jgi:polyhydroxyalkanoate synthesis regulator phasin
MRKVLIGSLLVAAVALGSLTVAALDPVGAVTATVTGKSHTRPGPLEQTLNDLVGKGTITQDQANAVTSEVQTKRQEAWAQQPRLGKELLTSAAQQLGMDPKDLVKELRSGKSIADVAHEKNVDPQIIIDKIVSTLDGRIDARVAAKKLDQQKADVMKQGLPARVTDFVNKPRGKGGKAGVQPPTTDSTPPSTDAPSTTAPDPTTSSSAADSTTTTTAATPSGTSGN